MTDERTKSGIPKRLLLAPTLLVFGTLLVSLGVGLFDVRLGMIVGGVFLCGLAFLVGSLIVRLEERKNGGS